MSRRRENENLSFTAAKGSQEAGISFQNIASLLWMNADIHEAGKWSLLPTTWEQHEQVIISKVHRGTQEPDCMNSVVSANS